MLLQHCGDEVRHQDNPVTEEIKVGPLSQSVHHWITRWCEWGIDKNLSVTIAMWLVKVYVQNNQGSIYVNAQFTTLAFCWVVNLA